MTQQVDSCGQQRVTRMQLEVSVAVNFVISFLYGKLPRRRVLLFGEELQRAIAAKFEGHWYPEQPVKGTAFRSLRVSGEQVDGVVFDAALAVGLEVSEVLRHLPDSLTVWVDPGEVSYRIGDKGSVSVLHAHSSQDQEFGCSDPDTAALAQQWMGQLQLESGSWGGQQQQQQQQQQWQQLSTAAAPGYFTAAAFAQTKFGSTKLRQHGRRPGRLGTAAAAAEGGRRHRGAAHHHQQQQQQLLGNGALHRSWSLSPSNGGYDWQPQLSVCVPGAYDCYHSNGSSRQASPGQRSDAGGSQQLLAK